MKVSAIGVLLTVLVVACGTARRAPDPDFVYEPPPQDSAIIYEAHAMVLEASGNGAQLCLGVVQTSLPPQCGGPSITNWDWERVATKESMGGVTWGEYDLLGTYDGESFSVTDYEGPPLTPWDSDPIDTPCETPKGGWRVIDPERADERSLNAAMARARASGDFAGEWVDYITPPSEEEENVPSKFVLNFGFRNDPEGHERELRRIWGGALCVVRFERTENDLARIQDELTRDPTGVDILTAGTFVTRNRVEITVVVIPEGFQEALDRRFGKGAVFASAALVPHTG